MSISSLQDISGSIIIKNDLFTANGSDIVLFQKWESIKHYPEDKSMSARVPKYVKQEMIRIEKELLQICQCDPNSDRATKRLTWNVAYLFKKLSQSCDTKKVCGDIVPVTPNYYFLLEQVYADEALSVLWNEIGKTIFLPDLETPEEKRSWLENAGNAAELNKIHQLNLSNKGLKIFPTEIQFCKNLQRLDLERNQIAEIPEDLNLPQLHLLNLSYNQLTALPHLDFSKLEVLKLSNNQIAALPYLDCPKLSVLDLMHNHIVTLADANLPEVVSLKLSNNRIATLPHLDFPKLQYLLLSDNQLAAFSGGNLPKLEILYLSNNQIVSLSDLNLPYLKDLRLDRNQVDTLSNLNFPELHYLDLYNNPIETLDRNLLLSSFNVAPY